MQIDLAGKNAVVTGAASGIGQACALALGAAGAVVVAVDIDAEGARETIDRIGGGLALHCDLRDPPAITAMREQVIGETGGVDMLVNSAGLIDYRQGVNAVSADEWDLLLDVNLRGTYLVCQAFMDSLKERRNGRIVTFSSLAARVGGVEVGIHYTSSKAGLIGLTRSLAKEGGPYGITANVVAPGVILTEPVKQQIDGHEDSYLAQIPLGRLGEAADVASVVLFLVSPLADYITGVVLDVNGGIYMG
jgi:NAD(P)-dependent dehydrogenase (short-subunit alcohol dehydrogenase family)